MLTKPTLIDAARDVMAVARKRRLGIVTAESCTCGMLAFVLSEAPGAAEWLHGGYLTYTKQQKTDALGVPPELLERNSAVCPEVAIAMAERALACSKADVAAA